MKLFGKRSKKEENNGCCNGDCNCKSVETDKKAKGDSPSVKVLGSGCAKCNQLETAASEALKQLGMDSTIEHVTDFEQIATYGVMSTPALVIDDQVVSYGKVLRTEEIVKILQDKRD